MQKKIIHIDMDAFYASVETRENPALDGKPLIIASPHARAVVCTANYAARAFGVHSAMPLSVARRLCPQGLVIAPRFALYRQVSAQIQAIFRRYSTLIEPIALDEAYLDVSDNMAGLPSATATASAIRQAIWQECHLTASAGVAPNKFLAKIASDWQKPNGQTVIAPARVAAFLDALSPAKIPGVGQATQRKLAQLGLTDLGKIRACEAGFLELHFGRYGYRLYDFARGIDHREVEGHRQRKSVSVETTLSQDEVLTSIQERLPELCAELAAELQQKQLAGRTITLKLKTADFQQLTRSQTYSSALSAAAELKQAAQALIQRIHKPAATRYRLIGIGVAGLQRQQAQTELWAE